MHGRTTCSSFTLTQLQAIISSFFDSPFPLLIASRSFLILQILPSSRTRTHNLFLSVVKQFDPMESRSPSPSSEDSSHRRAFDENSYRDIIRRGSNFNREVLPEHAPGRHRRDAIGFFFIVLTAIMTYVFVQQQQGGHPTSTLHSIIKSRQPGSQNNISRDASREIQTLGQLPAKVQGFEHIDAVVESATSGALSRSNAPRDALGAVQFTPTVLGRAAKSIQRVAKHGRTAGKNFKSLLNMAETAALSSPADVENKLKILRETVSMANASLDTVHELLNSTREDLQPTINNLALLHEAFRETLDYLVAEANRGPSAWEAVMSGVKNLTFLLSAGVFGGGISPQLEHDATAKLAQEISEARSAVANSIGLLHLYADFLEANVVARVRAEDVSSRWTKLDVLETWLSQGRLDLVDECIPTNYEELLGLLEPYRLLLE
ncbi:hypothetical protein IWZ03DRAFT_123987 [Phyllosticta citriasiana]|uniref:Transmembrane protein n=1 Tax=Phyllosticta citriasiana TaxID=595635 RepID=A0ABR1K807_9PEZI